MNEGKRICIVASARPMNLPYLLRGVASYGRVRGAWNYSLHLTGVPNLPEDVAALEPDGIILVTAEREFAESIAELGLPTVGLCRPLPERLVPSVRLDNERIGVVGARHLMEQGFENFAYCGMDTDWSRKRENGFVRTLGQEGHTCRALSDGATETRSAEPAQTVEDRERLSAWLEKLKKPVAVMCATDAVAAWVTVVCARLGIEVPSDVAVLGVDNVELWCEFAEPPISSVDPNLVRAGHEGSELLDSLMEGKKAPEEPVLVEPVGVKVRESTVLVAPEDDLVSEALDYVRDHIDQSIGVEDILEALDTSRSSLQRRFREALGRSPGEEIRRIRLERVRDLVLNSDMQLSEIAEASGFEYISHLCKAFKSAYGMSPKRYRRHHLGYSSALIPLSDVDPEALATYRAMEEEQESEED